MVRVRPDMTAAQDGGAGDADDFGYRYSKVMISLFLMPGEDVSQLLDLLRFNIGEDPGLSHGQDDKRVFWARWVDSDAPEKDGLGPKVDVWLSVAPLLS